MDRQMGMFFWTTEKANIAYKGKLVRILPAPQFDMHSSTSWFTWFRTKSWSISWFQCMCVIHDPRGQTKPSIIAQVYPSGPVCHVQLWAALSSHFVCKASPTTRLGQLFWVPVWAANPLHTCSLPRKVNGVRNAQALQAPSARNWPQSLSPGQNMVQLQLCIRAHFPIEEDYV